MPDAIQTTTLLAVIGLIIERAFQHLSTEKRPRNGAAGQKAPEYWELKIGQIVKQCLVDHENRITRPEMEQAAEMREEILKAVQDLDASIARGLAEIIREGRQKR